MGVFGVRFIANLPGGVFKGDLGEPFRPNPFDNFFMGVLGELEDEDGFFPATFPPAPLLARAVPEAFLDFMLRAFMLFMTRFTVFALALGFLAGNARLALPVVEARVSGCCLRAASVSRLCWLRKLGGPVLIQVPFTSE